MNIVIPMAGQGKRFVKSGFTFPKPLINVAGRAMYRHAVECLPLHLATKLIFILRKSNFLDSLISDIKTHYSSYPCSIVVLNYDTQGQAETVLKSASILDLEKPTLIHNCDTSISPGLPWQTIVQEDSDGAMVL